MHIMISDFGQIEKSLNRHASKFKKITLHVNPLLITHVGMQRWIWIAVNKFFAESGGGWGGGGGTLGLALQQMAPEL